MVGSPCLNCTKRSQGCHNPDVCAEWAAFQTALAADKELLIADHKLQNDLNGYKISVLRRQKQAMR